MTETPPQPRVWSRRTRLAVATAVTVTVAVAVAIGVVVATGDGDTKVLPDAAGAFGDDAVLEQELRWAMFSPSGRRVLVRTSDGIGVARGDDARAGPEVMLLTPPGSRAVTAAWFPGESAVLVAEGPIPTGQLAVVELDGTVRGSVPVTPSFGVGTGHGLAVGPRGRVAVAAAEQRDTIGGERHLHLVAVDLETGDSRPLTEPDGPDEFDPWFLEDDRVIYTETTKDPTTRSRVMALEVTTGVVTPVSPREQDARAVGIVGGRPAYVTGAEIWLAGREPRRLATVDGHVLAVHPQGRLMVVSRAGTAHLEAITARKREVLPQVPPPPTNLRQ